MRHIELYDTTLRDGAQAEGVAFSLPDKLRFARYLDALSFDFLEGGYPASNEKDAEFFTEIRKSPLHRTQITAFGMTRRKNTRAAEDAGLAALVGSEAGTITLVGKSSRFQAEEVLLVSVEENLAMIDDSIRFLRAADRQVIFDAEHFFDGYRRDPAYSLTVLETAVAAGASHVVLCDTNGGSMPGEVRRIVRDVVDRCSEMGAGTTVGVHCHNDCGLAVANSLVAVEAGASHIQGTINGFGERCGNADLTTVAACLAIKLKDGNDRPLYEVLEADAVRKLTELSRFLYELLNKRAVRYQPFVGQSAFAHKGGMHVSGLARSSASYEHIDPSLVGNERRILISELSGRSNLVALAKKFQIAGDRVLMDRILAELATLERHGYQYEAAEGSFSLLVRKCDGSFRSHFDLFRYQVQTLSLNGEADTVANLWTRVDDRELFTAAEGDGPVHAMDVALRKALELLYPQLRSMSLVDYKVRVVNAEAATAAKVVVVIESHDDSDGEVWSTIGVHENIIEASRIALTDAVEYKLHKRTAMDTSSAPEKRK
ncbi:MAG: citramalate synthase [Planctomycetia bacterium]|nr:citramalate synthase [Planctomycetia bacterium]